ncbi:hypothetical protein AKJ37_04970 [candidate division MSBL1 archaeon SCGC-AAA259I09]|uniref:CARDB domain-containing protein n=1 Tax=candidate division MSBL1 archaeon SCGC-AAA259I09 TaxID=1698267 RepID=A0A133UQY9_9EURY|nr:hypothetical protein AKJ37_04970 [candidate division MSBL1 archaeon SCGC-AAA259I09]
MNNTGFDSGTYKASLKINGKVTDSRTVDLPMGGNKEVQFEVSKSEEGTYDVGLGRATDSFEVRKMPKLVVKDLQIKPQDVRPEESVTVTAVVKNEGQVEGSEEYSLKLNGSIIDSKKITLKLGESGEISFKVTQKEEGNYNVELGGLSDSFVVRKGFSKLSISTSVSATRPVGLFSKKGTPSLKVSLQGEEKHYDLTLIGPKGKKTGTGFSSVSDMEDGSENIWLQMADPYTSPKAGTYTLLVEEVVENLQKNNVYENEFTFSGSELVVENWGIFEFGESFTEEGKYEFESFSVALLNKGDLPAYLGETKIIIGKESYGYNLRESSVIIPSGEKKKIKIKDRRGPLDRKPLFNHGVYDATCELFQRMKDSDKLIGEYSKEVYIPHY